MIKNKTRLEEVGIITTREDINGVQFSGRTICLGVYDRSTAIRKLRETVRESVRDHKYYEGEYKLSFYRVGGREIKSELVDSISIDEKDRRRLVHYRIDR